MKDKTKVTREAETPDERVSLNHWDHVAWVTPMSTDPSREPTCLEWVIATTLANAVAVANAPFCCAKDDGIANIDLRQVIKIIAEQTHAGMLDDAILLLRDVLKHCIKRGDSSVFSDAEAETTKP